MNNELKLKWLWNLAGISLLLVVAIGSLMPAPDTGVNDKASHLLAYAVMSGWFSLLVDRPVRLIWVLIALFLYGALIEFLQSMTADRYAEWGDVVANSIGILLGLIAYFSPFRNWLIQIDRRLVRFKC
ncbi:MAG: VanZ family protein [Pseudomonadota bacterium]